MYKVKRHLLSPHTHPSLLFSSRLINRKVLSVTRCNFFSNVLPVSFDSSLCHRLLVSMTPSQALPFLGSQVPLSPWVRFDVPVGGGGGRYRRSTDQGDVGPGVPYPSSPFRTHVSRFKQARGWLGAVYFGLTAQHSGYIYLAKLLAI